MIRGFHLADWFTLANAASGMAAIFAAVASLSPAHATSLLLATAFIPCAFVFDVLDGRIARWRQQQSALGRELDSLADVISFGVAPAVIGYAAGMQGFLDCVVLGYFVCCGVSRLARYNITAEALSQESAAGKVKYFEGTPIPTSIFLVFVVAIAAWTGRTGEALWLGRAELGPWTLHPLVLMYALSGSLMISKTLRIPKL
jgi:CDP-diacylglycerol--serine O-phosphatidyltransferase